MIRLKIHQKNINFNFWEKLLSDKATKKLDNNQKRGIILIKIQ